MWFSKGTYRVPQGSPKGPLLTGMANIAIHFHKRIKNYWKSRFWFNRFLHFDQRLMQVLFWNALCKPRSSFVNRDTRRKCNWRHQINDKIMGPFRNHNFHQKIIIFWDCMFYCMKIVEMKMLIIFLWKYYILFVKNILKSMRSATYALRKINICIILSLQK